ncbi:hypothetical protein LINGRAHAP2_LOCUS28616 [Linum grandiflorum]
MKQKTKPTKRRLFLICSIATSILLIFIILVGVILGFTVFRPRNPTIILYPVGLKDFSLNDLLIAKNVTAKLVIQITNRNHIGFKFRNATSVALYGHDDNQVVVGEVQIVENEIPTRSTVNLTAPAVLMASKMRRVAVGDIARGEANLTSKVTLHGKSSVMGLKLKASVYVECYLTVVALNRTLDGSGWCWTKMKMK